MFIYLFVLTKNSSETCIYSAVAILNKYTECTNHELIFSVKRVWSPHRSVTSGLFTAGTVTVWRGTGAGCLLHLCLASCSCARSQVCATRIRLTVGTVSARDCHLALPSSCNRQRIQTRHRHIRWVSLLLTHVAEPQSLYCKRFLEGLSNRGCVQ